MYHKANLLAKNRDDFRQDMLEMLGGDQDAAQNDFVYDMFERQASVSSGRSTSRKKPTVANQFKTSLSELMKMLNAADPFFVRCIKPNVEKNPDSFVEEVVLNQLRYSGMLETVRIRKAGFPVRRIYSDFSHRFRILAGASAGNDPRATSETILKKYDETGAQFKMGKTKAFLKESIEQILEEARQAALKTVIEKIQAVCTGYIIRKRYLKITKGFAIMRAIARCAAYVQEFQGKRVAATKIQAGERGRTARKFCKKKRSDEKAKKLEEQRRKEQEEADRQAEIKRLEEEAKADAAKQEELQKLQEEQEAAEMAFLEEEQRRMEEMEAEEEAMAQALEKAKALGENLDKKAEEKRIAEESAEREKEAEAKRAEADAEEEEQRRADEEAYRKELEDEQQEEEEEAYEYMEGYLGKIASKAKQTRRSWCVLNNGVFMVFKSKQDSLKSGWLTKLGGGTSTFGRQNWKKRWVTLRSGILNYHPTDEEDAEVLGWVDIQNCKGVLSPDDVHAQNMKVTKDKPNIFAMVTDKRTYYMYPESIEEAKEWVAVLQDTRGKTSDEIKQMHEAAMVDPRNAISTVDIDDIISVSESNERDPDGRPIFVMHTPDRMYKFVAADQAELENWISKLRPKERNGGGDAMGLEGYTERGWLMKKGGSNDFLRKRWFVLKGDVISYYKQPGDEFTVGSIPLNSLCSVDPPDEEDEKKNGEFRFIVHSRRKSFHLYGKSMQDARRWVDAIQDVIDNSQLVETPTEKLIDELKLAPAADMPAIYQAHKILTFSPDPIRAPLLPLPYGEIVCQSSSRSYGTLNEEALLIAQAVCPARAGEQAQKANKYGNFEDPVKMIKAIIQACFDVPKLRNEVYCQVIKQTTILPKGSGGRRPSDKDYLVIWQLLSALCASFLPSRKFLRFLKFHLSRCTSEQELLGKLPCASAVFCLELLGKTKQRDFPPSTAEIKAIQNRQDMVVSIHSVGNRQVDLAITSSTTVREVIVQVKQQFKLDNCVNGFGLFENCGLIHKYLEERYAVADIVSKWEKYEAHGINTDGENWRLFFKLFSFFDPRSDKISLVEQEFLFEQAFDSVMNRRYPADNSMLIKLAACRTQWMVGDFEEGAYISDVIKVHPAQAEALLAQNSQGTLSSAAGTIKKAVGTIKGTLRGFGKNTLRKLSGGRSGNTLKGIKVLSDAELNKVKGDIVNQWKTMKGYSQDDARLAYMAIIQSWEGYGANLFEVEQTTTKAWPKELWLAISLRGVGIFERHAPKRLAYYSYETVLSFGAPVANKYKIMVDNVGSMLFETNMVLEIAKLMKEYIRRVVEP
jgi:myosin X